MDIQEANTFKDVMGFNVATNEVFYEDDATDTTIPDIQVNFIRINYIYFVKFILQKVTRKNNILPIWGNIQTMNL